MGNKQAIWYSIIRYTSNFLTGEIVNVGLIMHLVDTQKIHFTLIDESSSKIRAIEEANGEVSLYKSYKDTFEFYLKNNSNLFGSVGNVIIASPTYQDFMTKLYENYQGQKLQLSKPSFSLTGNPDGIFETLFETYIGKNYLDIEHKEVSVKTYIKKVFEEKHLLGKKVASDIQLNPIKTLSNIRIKVDFGYRNGAWNYIQAVPSLVVSKPTDWFAKTKLMHDAIHETGDKIILLYRKTGHQFNGEMLDLINYFNNDKDTSNINLDNDNEFNALCEIIERDAHDLENVS